MPNILKALEFMVSTAKDDTHGYDQAHRNAPDYDCSSLVGTALHNAGFNVSPKSWTGNLRKQLLDCGFEEIPVKSERKAGDIFLSEYHHVVMCVDKDNIVHASINEKGTVKGGKTGDQTGKEICIRSFYTPSYGWNYHFRYPSLLSLDEISREVINGKWGNGKEREQRLVSAGYDYKSVQGKVNSILSEKYEKTVEEIAFEVIDGKWGNGVQREAKLTEAGYSYTAVQKLVNELLK